MGAAVGGVIGFPESKAINFSRDEEEVGAPLPDIVEITADLSTEVLPIPVPDRSPSSFFKLSISDETFWFKSFTVS
jgi:hypothetical protein